MENNKAIHLHGPVSWIGVQDSELITFDIVMETKYGTTYNAYFIDADKKAVVDTVKKNFFPDFLGKIRQIADPADIEYIVCNHTEPDHSGSVVKLLEQAPDATVAASAQGLKYLKEMTGKTFKTLQVRDGDTLDLGNRTLKFIGAPNLHWPDSIYTYIEQDQMLFTCDSFGAHYCHPALFDDLVGEYRDAFKYYFDVILRPFSKFMLKAIEKIDPLDIRMICPGHGPVLRSTWKEKVELSRKYATRYLDESGSKRNRILITYVSAYGYTGEMARIIASGIKRAGEFEIDIADIENMPPAELEQKIIRTNAILIGSPTINQNTLPQIYNMFGLINPVRDKGKHASAFGSYGWSGEAIRLISGNLRNLKLQVHGDGISIRFYPNQEKQEELIRFGEMFGKKMIS